MGTPTYSCRVEGSFILVTDHSNETGATTVTNAPEEVIERLARDYHLAGRCVLYRDTEGRWDELLVEGDRFAGFRHVGGTSDEDAMRRVIARGEQEVAAHEALRRFVDAGVDLARAWERRPDALAESYPGTLPDFDALVTSLIVWRDATARTLGVPEGDGTAGDEVPPQPPGIPADDPEDPALDIVTGDGTTRRERLEAEARLARYRELPPRLGGQK